MVQEYGVCRYNVGPGGHCREELHMHFGLLSTPVVFFGWDFWPLKLMKCKYQSLL